jgi:Mg2+-importing ATPase
MRLTLLLVMVIFAVNVYFERPVVDSFLFSLALAVGLTPQLLPAITSITLSHGARRMAREKVIVRRLSSIENFGSMNVLCSDKTGTLTEGVVRLHSALDLAREESEKVFLYAYLNAFYETGYLNPIDRAIRDHDHPDISGYEKLDEVPCDFVRKRLSVLVSRGDETLLITKGALNNVLSICSSAELPGGEAISFAQAEEQIRDRFEELSGRGFRTLGIAYKKLHSRAPIGRESESGMTFLGFLVLNDPPKAGITGTIGRLRELGGTLKIVTGDNRLVAASVGEQVGLSNPEVLTGSDLHRVSDAALPERVKAVDIFAEVEPNQKERIILALKKTGNVVGYLDDGILPHVRCPLAVLERHDGPIPHGLVPGVGGLGHHDRARHAHPQAFFQEPAEQVPDARHPAGRRGNTLPPLHPCS